MKEGGGWGVAQVEKRRCMRRWRCCCCCGEVEIEEEQEGVLEFWRWLMG